MSGLPCNANICETGDAINAYYQVQLEWVPRAGELIKLYSYNDVAWHWYEVLQVVHEIHEVSEKSPTKNGGHFVTVHVKHSESSFFGS